MNTPNPKVLIASVLIIYGCADVRAADQSEIDMSNLSETQVTITPLTQPNSPGKSFAAATIINAPMQKLCSILLNFSDYSNFMPNTEKATVTFSDDKSSTVDMTLKLPLGKIKKYRLKMEPKISQVSCQLSWRLVPWEGLKQEETIVDTSGYWRLTPHPSNNNKTLVKYLVHTDPGPVPLGLGWIVDTMSKDSIPKTLEALRTKAASL